MGMLGWRRRLFLCGVATLGAGFIVLGSFWPIAKKWIPSLSEKVIIVASSPISWFVLSIFVLSFFIHLSKTREASSFHVPLGVSGAVADDIGSVFANADHLKVDLFRVATVYDGGMASVPTLKVEFASNGRNMTFYLECSVFINAVGFFGWGKAIKFELKKILNYSVGQDCLIPLIEEALDETGSKYWRWCTSEDRLIPINRSGTIRGRVTALSDDFKENHVYFILLMKGPEFKPVAIGDHLFSHMFEWEGKEHFNKSIATVYI